MAAELLVQAWYDGDADARFEEARDYAGLAQSMAGLARYDGLPNGLAEQGDSFVVDVALFGRLRLAGHAIHVERLDPDARVIQSREGGPSVRRWDHTLTVAPAEGGCVWRDRVIIDAGWRTIGAVRFAAYMYAYRHRRRHALRITRRIARATA